MAAEKVYRHAGVVCVRASTDPGGLEPPADLDLDDPASLAGCGRAWLAHVWDRCEVQAALRIASPALSRQIVGVLAGRHGDHRQVRRLISATYSYLLRWRTRPTPFGLFAGVTTAEVTGMADRPGRARAWFGSDHQLRARPDARWLSALIDRLEHDPDLLPRLRVTCNNLGSARGDRFVLPLQPDEDALRRGASRDVAVWLSRPVQIVLAATTSPVLVGDLTALLRAQFSAASPDQIRQVVAGLLEHQVLISSLRAPMTTLDSLAHLIEQLDQILGQANSVDEGTPPDLADLADLGELATQLRAIHHALARASRSPCPGQAMSADPGDPGWTGLAERMRTVVPTMNSMDTVVAVDLAVDADFAVPQAVLREAEAAASVLLRTTPHPFGVPAWRDWHRRFRDRYGAGAVVPIREIVADSGLGFPAGYLDAPRGHTTRTLTDRDATLQALIQQAMIEGRTEIQLTDPVLHTLTVGHPGELIPPPRVELAVQVHAASRDALEHGQFRLWVTGAPRPESSMIGRFTHLLPPADQARLADSYTAGTDAVTAQLSFPPRRLRNDNIARANLLNPVISLSEHRAPDAGVIGVDDLAVTGNATQLWLIQLSTGDRIHPYAVHALEAAVHTPPLARFLTELATARCGVHSTFDFGAARTLPFLPRVRHGRTVLSSARWLLHATGFPNPDQPTPEWDTAVRAWRDRWHVPAHVHLCHGDARLPIDLDHRPDRTLLRDRVRKTGRVELREAPAPAEFGWTDGRVCELVIPLVRRDPHTVPARSRRRRVAGGDVLLPGRTNVLHAQLTGHPMRFDTILTEHLPRLFTNTSTDASPVRSWWFARQHDTTRPDSDHHLSLYLRLATMQDYGVATGRVADWANVLATVGLVADLTLRTYHPQQARYGFDDVLAAAQEVFAADSAAAVAQLSLAADAGLPGQALAAVSMTDLAAGLAPTPVEGLGWLLDTLPQHTGKLDRSLRDTTLELAVTPASSGWGAQPGGNAVDVAWEHRRTALATYRTQLAQERDPATVLRSLLHDHHIRALGVDPDQEQVTNRLARAVAQRRLAQHTP